MLALYAHVGYAFMMVVSITALLLAGFGLLGITWCKDVFRAWDKLGAAIAGKDGFHTISAHCGAGDFPGHAILRPLIDAAFGHGHCEDAARKEGLIA